MLLGACAAVLVAATSVVVYQGGVRTEGSPSLRVGPASPSRLTAPALGSVGAERLADGTPVWVVRHGDNTVSVVSAISTHTPYGLQQLVGWCASTRGFEDALYGSMWDEYGHKRGGPAPTALPTAPSVVTGSQVVAGSLVTDTAAPHGQWRGGQPCLGILSPYDPGPARQHSVGQRGATTVQHVEREVTDHPSGRVEFVTGAAIVVAADDSVRLCAAKSPKPESTCAHGPRVEGIDAAAVRAGRASVPTRHTVSGVIVIRGDLLLRSETHAVRDITFVKGYDITDH
jgi:hypothetical protein